jgi:predicted CopG family antitoxin
MTCITSKTSNNSSSITAKKLKMIAVSEANYQKLRELGHTPESFNDVITKLIEKEELT